MAKQKSRGLVIVFVMNGRISNRTVFRMELRISTHVAVSNSTSSCMVSGDERCEDARRHERKSVSHLATHEIHNLTT